MMCVNVLSPPAKITMEVPQGSILGPLLFLVYINGIQSELHHSKMTMFADVMAFYCHENWPTNLQSKLNADLAAFTTWLHDNKLTLNVTKSKFMIIGGRNKLSQFNDIALVANNDQLENVTKFKYLGVIINQRLTWHDHIEQLHSKIAKRLGVLKPIKHLPVYARRIYLSTMVIPIAEVSGQEELRHFLMLELRTSTPSVTRASQHRNCSKSKKKRRSASTSSGC